MKVFYAKFDGHYLGGVAVVVAVDATAAASALALQLRSEGLAQTMRADEMIEVDSAGPAQTLILFNGDY